MKYFPLFIHIKDINCLIVGGGAIAARKLKLLAHCNVTPTVISPRLDGLFGNLPTSTFAYVERTFHADDLKGCSLVIAATDDPELNREIARLCRRKGILVNVVDQPALCSAIFPSIVDRSPVVIALSTGGASPLLSRLLRARIEMLIPEAYGKLAILAGQYREKAKRLLSASKQRQRFWEKVLHGPISEMIFANRETEAHAAIDSLLEEHVASESFQGEVYLVGAGPGDPELLTLRAMRLLQQADVVVYDRLVSQPILDRVRRGAEKIYVGKKRADHSLSQEGINTLLVRLAKEGKRVLRLKGGDPFIFGRGGEEIETLIDESIPFQVVPGITAASGCASYAGIPLTHRDHSQACIFVTGHLKDGTVDLNWSMLAHTQQTVVFYMGLYGVGVICKQLIMHGRKTSTPAALIQQGTTENHRVLIGDLHSLPELVEQNDVSAPTLIIVGEVVSLHEKLHWYKPESEIIDNCST